MSKLIKFEREGCTPCEMMQKFLDNEGLETANFDPVVDEDMATKFNIMSVPVLIVLDDNGNEINRSTGFNVDKLKEIANFIKQ